MDEEEYQISGVKIGENEKSWLVMIDDEEEIEVWLPKSQCAIVDEDYSGMTVFKVPLWIIEKHDLEQYVDID